MWSARQPPTESGSLYSAPDTTRRHSARSPTPCSCALPDSEAWRSMPMRAVPESVLALSGATSCLERPSWVSLPCTAQVRMLASSVTHLAAVSVFYHRRHGLARNQVTAIELVISGGEQIRGDAENEPDLFWALRGGGGSFGVVTTLEFNLLPLPEIFAGALLFPAQEASQVLQGWREWSAGMPEEMTSVGRLMNFPA